MAASKSIVELILQAKVEGEKTFQQLTDATTKLMNEQAAAEKTAASYDQQLEKMRGTLDGLVRAERDLVAKGRLVERFKEQAAATGRADASAKKLAQTAHDLRTELQQLDKGSSDRQKLEKQFDRASLAAQKAAKNFRKQRADLAKLNAQMKKAGLATGNLAHAERQLAGEARRLQGAQERTATSLAKVKVKADQAALSMGRLGKNSRTSLGLMQRMRGEVLALGAAYVGLFGVGREVGNVFQAVRQKEAIESRFRVAFDGDPEQAAKVEAELRFVRQTADKLKISFLTLGTEYSKFIAAVPEGIFTLEQQRKIFSDIATGARVMRLSQDEVAGTFKAIIQIASKGQFQMEELRGQLGDRLPGALLLFAKQMKVSTRELDKMVEQGEVGADKLTVLAEAIENKFGGDLSKALAASTTQLDAFLLEVERLRIDIGGSSGLVDVLGDSLHDLAEEIQRPEFKEGLIGLARFMGLLAKAGVLLVQNLDAVKNALIAFVGVRLLGSLVKGFFSARSAALKFAGALRALGLVGALASGPAGWIAALIIGIATIALTSRKSGPDIDFLIQKYADLGDAAEEAGNKITDSLGSPQGLAIDQEINTVITELGHLVTELRRLESFKGRNHLLASVLGTDDEISVVLKSADNARKKIRALREEREKLLLSQKAIKPSGPVSLGLNEKQIEDLEKAIEQANKVINKFEAVTLAQKLAQVDKAFGKLLETAQGTAKEESRLKQVELVTKAIAAKKRSITIEEERKLQKEFQRLELSAAKQSQDTLQGRLDNIRLKYEGFIEKLRGAGLNTLADRTDSILSSELAGEIDHVKAKLRETLTQIRAEDANDLDARLQLIRDKYTKLIADLNAAGDIEGVNLAGDTQKAEEDAARLAHAEEEINRLMEVRQSRLERINLEREAGIIGTLEAQDQMRSAVEDLDPKLQGLLDKAIAIAEAMGNPQMVENLRGMQAEIKVSANNLNPFADKIEQINNSFAGGLTSGISDWVGGVASAKDAFLRFGSDFLLMIGQMILKQQVLNSMQAAGGAGSGGVGSFFAGLFHQGGIVGAGGSGRAVSPLAFAGAYRYHGGGIAGIRPDETGAILQKGEEVLTKTDPRHRNNGGRGESTRTLQPMIFFDQASLTRAMLSSPTGVETMVSVVGDNPEKFNQS